MVVPAPERLSIEHAPPISAMRWRMLRKPSAQASCGGRSKPWPSSVTVTDDGQGFERPPQDAWADGLRNMRQRMAEIGGACSIDSRSGAGTTIRFDVPWRN